MCQQQMFYSQIMQELEGQEERIEENELPAGSMENPVFCECE